MLYKWSISYRPKNTRTLVLFVPSRWYVSVRTPTKGPAPEMSGR